MLRQPVSCFHKDSICKGRASWVGKLCKEVVGGLEKGWRPTWPFGHCPNKHVKGCHCWAQSWNLRESVGALPPRKPTHLLGLCVKTSPGEWSRIFAKSWLKKKMMFPMNSKNRTSHSSITLSIWWTRGRKQDLPKKEVNSLQLWLPSGQPELWSHLSLVHGEGSRGNDRWHQQGGE